MLVHDRVTPSIKFAGTHLYTLVDSVLSKSTTCCPRAGVEPGSLGTEFSTLTIRPMRLHKKIQQ